MTGIQEIDAMWNGEFADPILTRLEPGTYRGIIDDYTVCQVGMNKTWALLVQIRTTTPEENEGIKVEKCYYLTPKSMPYVARDLKDLGCQLFHDKKLSDQMQNLPLKGVEVDFRYDIPKEKEYSEVIWLKLAKNSATVPQGAGDGIRAKGKPAAKSEPKTASGKDDISF